MARYGDVEGRALGVLLAGARERAGLTVRDLAARLGLSASTVSEAERGRDPRASTLAAYARALPGLTAARLLAEDPACAGEEEVALLLRAVFGLAVRRAVALIDARDGAPRLVRLRLQGVRPVGVDARDPEVLRGLLELSFRGTPNARAGLARLAAAPGARAALEDGPWRHELSISPAVNRVGFAWTRTLGEGRLPPGAPWTGRPPLSAPFPRGVSVPVDLPIDELVIVARVPRADVFLAAAWHAWADGLALAPRDADLAQRLRCGPRVSRSPRDGTLRLRLRRPALGLHHALAWGEAAGCPRPRIGGRAGAQAAATAPAPAGRALRRAREEAGLSQRGLAGRLRVSAPTVAAAERGQDVRRSLLVACLRELPALSAGDLLPPGRALAATREEAWRRDRDILGVEADEERKTLVITPGGDAHAVCEIVRLRCVREPSADLRIRHGSPAGHGQRLPTELKAIEDALEAEESALRARVVARQEGRVIHEIAVPAELALSGVSYSRRLFTPRFFDPAEEEADAPPFHGAAVVPFHPARKLRLEVRFPRGAFPERAWFGVHPRLMLAAPAPEADLAARLHPEGLVTRADPRARSLVLEAELPLVGFLYDVFWERPARR